MTETFDLNNLGEILGSIQRDLEAVRKEKKILRQEIVSFKVSENAAGNSYKPPTFGFQKTNANPSSVAPSQVIHSLSPVIPLAPPERFNGDPQKAQTFLTQCSLHFMCRPTIFPDAQSCVAFILSYLSGDAASWSMPIVTNDDPVLYNLEDFKKEFLRIFDRRTASQAMDNDLLELKQGNRELVAYLAQFNKLVVGTGWPEHKRAAVFYRGLREELKDALSQIPNRPTEISALVDLVLEIDFRQNERKGEKRREFRPSVPRFDRIKAENPRSLEGTSGVEPMQIGAMRGPLSKEEKEKRRQNKLCMYCGGSGHYVRTCQKRPKTPNKEKENLQHHQ